MKKISLLYFLLSVSLAVSGQAPNVPAAQLQKMAGQWEGTLTYTDYSDDESKSTLACQMSSTWKGKKGLVKIGFTEPNGMVVYDKVKIKLSQDGNAVKFDGSSYQADQFNMYGPSGNWTLIISCMSTDNYKEAAIKQTIAYSDTALTLTKEVKYLNSSVFFVRNRYDFERVAK